MKTLSDVLLPWKEKDQRKSKQDTVSHVTVEMIRNKLNELSYECKTGPIKHRRGAPTKEDLQTVVEHFMKLFDVEDTSGTFARMNDIYVKNSEMSNVLHTLKDLLGLGKLNFYRLFKWVGLALLTVMNFLMGFFYQLARNLYFARLLVQSKESKESNDNSADLNVSFKADPTFPDL